MSEWKTHVLPHSPLNQLADGLWQVTGSLPRKVGKLPRNMVVYRMPSGGLFIHSAIAMNDTEMQKLEALGRPEVMMVPNRMHRLDAGVYKQRYPGLKVFCPRAAIEAVDKVVAVDGTAEEKLSAYGIRCHSPAGLKPEEVALELSLTDKRALVVTDLLFNLPSASGLDGFILKLLGCSGYFGMTPIGRLALLGDRKQFSGWLREMAELRGLSVITVAHGDAVTERCSQRLREAADRLSPDVRAA